MAILSDYEETDFVKKPFNAVLDSSNPLQFLQTAFEFVDRETDLFKKDSVIKDVNGLVRSVKEKVDSDERKRKEKSVPTATSAGASVKVDNKRAKEESSPAGPSQTGRSVKEPKDQKVEETNNDDKKGLRDGRLGKRGVTVASPLESSASLSSDLNLEDAEKVVLETMDKENDMPIDKTKLILPMILTLVNVDVKVDLVKQHAKVAEEAVAGWEKAENEATTIKLQLEDVVQQNLALEDNVFLKRFVFVQFESWQFR